MLYIAHRGNTEGNQFLENENKLESAIKCLKQGLCVELDLWFESGDFYLGHDCPTTLLKDKEIVKLNERYPKKIFWHCKSIDTLYKVHIYEYMFNNNYYFFHQSDDVVLTQGDETYFWNYPGKQLTFKSICVMPEICSEDYNHNMIVLAARDKIKGICSDYILDIKNQVEEMKNELQIK